MRGNGYGRIDYRIDKDNKLFFLELNAMPKTFCPLNEMGSADEILT